MNVLANYPRLDGLHLTNCDVSCEEDISAPWIIDLFSAVMTSAISAINLANEAGGKLLLKSSTRHQSHYMRHTDHHCFTVCEVNSQVEARVQK